MHAYSKLNSLYNFHLSKKTLQTNKTRVHEYDEIRKVNIKKEFRLL